MSAPPVTCTPANTLATQARALGWDVDVRPGRGTLPYTHKGDPKPDGGHFNVLVDEPVWSVGVYMTRGDRTCAAFYVARDLPERRTSKGALSWSLHCAIGRKVIADGHTPTAFQQATETTNGKTRAVGPTTRAQLLAYLTEHGAEAQLDEPEQPTLQIDLGARPKWTVAA